MGILQSVFDQYPVLIHGEDLLLRDNYAPDTINCPGNRLATKLTDILVTIWTKTVATIFMQPQVKFRTMLDHCLVKRGEQHMVLVVQLRNRHDKQSMVLPRITIHNSSAVISS